MNVQPYELVIAPSARRHLSERLPEAVTTAVFGFIAGALLENPHRVGKQLDQPYVGRWCARRGTYRVIYDIDEHARCVTVLKVLARRDAYRPR